MTIGKPSKFLSGRTLRESIAQHLGGQRKRDRRGVSTSAKSRRANIERRLQTQSLEARQLLAGPELVGIQPNTGQLIQGGTSIESAPLFGTRILQTSPNELTFQFDDNSAIDPATLLNPITPQDDSIRPLGLSITRAGADGAFETATAITDLNTSGNALIQERVEVEFRAATSLPGVEGNGTQVLIERYTPPTSVDPVIRFQPVFILAADPDAKFVRIGLNTLSPRPADVRDLTLAVNNSAAASQVIRVDQISGNAQTRILSTLPAGGLALTLDGANTARVVTDLQLGQSTSLEIVAKQSGAAGTNLRVVLTSQNFGGPTAPLINVTNQTINVRLNSSPGNQSTIGELVAALNSNPTVANLISATLRRGDPTDPIGGLLTPTPGSNGMVLQLTGASDTVVTPGFVGIGDRPNEVVFRFAEPLPEDTYQIEIYGTGDRALRNTNDEAFNDGVDFAVQFEINTPPRVLAVVPEPVTKSGNRLISEPNVVEVYFTEDVSTSGAGSVLNASYYDAIYTRDTVTGNDDGPNGDGMAVSPIAVEFIPGRTDAVRVIFEAPFARVLDATNPGSFVPGAVRLRVGTDSLLPNQLTPQDVTPSVTVNEAGDSIFADADQSGPYIVGGFNGTDTSRTTGIRLTGGRIENTAATQNNVFQYPGGVDYQGVRNLRPDDPTRDTRVVPLGVWNQGGDQSPGISTIYYNFPDEWLGDDANSQTIDRDLAYPNSITAEQRQRVREVAALFSEYLGVQFIEVGQDAAAAISGTSFSGAPGPVFSIAVGSLEGANDGSFVNLVSEDGGLTVVARDLDDQGDTFLTQTTSVNNGNRLLILDAQDFDDSIDDITGGEFFRGAFLGIGQLLGYGYADHLPQPITQSAGGVLDPVRPVQDLLPATTDDLLPPNEAIFPSPADIINGQFLYRPESNDIDLYEFTLANAGTINISTIAERLGSSSQLDTMLRLYRIEDGKPIEIAANDDYFSNDSLIELKVQPGRYVVGVSASGNDEYDPIISGTGSGGVSEGDYELAMSFTPDSSSTITDGSGLALDGDSDGESGGVFQFWFEPNDPNTTVFVDNTIGSASGTGNIVSPYNTLNAAFQAVEARRNSANPVKVVRVSGEGGVYRIGTNVNGGNLTNGEVRTVEVPKGVNLVLDAGVRFEMSGNRIGVGSTTFGVDRSGATIQVLGKPDNPVQLVGIGQSNPGTWGGIDIRGDIDFNDDSRENLENSGVFLNHIQFADIQGGGGRVNVDGVSRVVAPIELADTRATILNNIITRSADAAIAATPDTFLETRFDESRFQTEDGTNEFFTSDFVRVGPHIRGNTVIDNTYNGLLIRIDTPSGSGTETLTVNARFDDTDIVHILTENLLIEGTPGGSSAMTDRPSTALVTTVPRVNTVVSRFGDIPQGQYGYRLTFVTSDGFETVSSNPIGVATLTATGSITLNNLPTVSTAAGFTGRRLYRAPVIGRDFNNEPIYGDFLRVARLNPSTGSFTDTQLNGTTQIADSLIGNNSLAFTGRLDPGLTVDPGTIVKLDGARIDVTFDARLFAEGTENERIVFTSLNDRRFGTGGTFNTNGQFQDSTAGALTSFNPGDWSGIYVGFGADASFDHTVFAGGGGTSQIEGGFASFNVIEAHQSDLRIANSRFENNADGRRFLNDGGNDTNNPDDPREQRVGRVNNASGTIFVRGSQPTILDNTFIGGQGPTLSFDVNSFTWEENTDPGRSTGPIDQLSTRGNSGPLIQGNRIDGGLAGMEVRGGSVATEVVWDDTDIVHIVRDTIEVPNQHIYGGLRLESDARASLVVKFENQTSTTDDPLFNRRAGIVVGGNIYTAEDEFTGIADRIGGSLQVIGQPDFPVILTALIDDAVGAGFTPDGRANVDTDGNGIVLQQRTAVELDQRLPTRLPVSREFAEVDQEIDLGRDGNILDPTSPYIIDNDIDVVNQRGHLETSVNYGGLFERVEFTGENTLTAALVAANLEFLNTNYINITPDPLPFVPNPAPVQLFDAFLPTAAGVNPVEIELASEDRVITTGIYDIDYELAGSPDFGVPFATIFGRQIRWRAETFILDNRGTIYTQLNFETVDELPFNAGRVQFVDVINYNDPGTAGLDDDDNILFQVGTPGEADFRLVTVDDDNGLAFAHGGVYENDSFNQVNAGYIGFSAGSAGANKFVLNNIQQDVLVTAVSSDLEGPHFQPALGYLPIQVEPLFETVTPGTFAIGVNGLPADIDTAHQWRLNNSSITARVTAFVEFIPSDPARDPIVFDLPSPIPGSGSWDGIVIREAASDSNASITSENEPANVGNSDTNAIASRSQFLGEVAPDRKSGDENRRLGLIVDGEISSPGDIDVYSFVAEAGTQVWIDIDRTNMSLDTVIELVNSNGQTMALSDDAFREAAQIEELLSIDAANTDPAVIARRDELIRLINSRTGRGTQAVDSGSIFGLATGQLDSGLGLVPFQDQYSTNSRDAGMRVILPGVQGTRTLYHVRVRSSITPQSKASLTADGKNRMIVGDTSNVIDNAESLRTMQGGLRLGETQGSYQLQVRVEEADVFAGTQIRYSDVLYADNGVQVVGGPLHGPLSGENYEIDTDRDNDDTTSNNTLAGAQRLGLYDTQFVNGALVDNPGQFANTIVNADGSLTLARNGVDIVLDNPAGPLGSDRLATNISGFIDGTGDVDWYEFEINYSQLTRDGAALYLATVFDLDYTDGLGRADLALYVFDAAGQLVLIGGDSNIADDISLPGTGGATDLSRGSFGTADPYIGSAEMPEGTYFVAVSNQGQVPPVLDQFNNRDTINPLIRLEPIDSTRRIAEEGFDSTFLGLPSGYSQVFQGPVTPVLFDQNSIIDYSLDDVFLYVNSGSNLFLVNPFTGTQYVNLGGFEGQEIRDIAFTANGELFGYTQYDGPPADDAYSYVRINTVTGGIEEIINEGSGLATFNDQDIEAPPAIQILDQDSDVGVSVEAITIRSRFGNETGFFVGNRPGGASAVGLEYNTNILYSFDEETGLATGPAFDLTLANAGAGTDIREIGQIDTAPPVDINGVPINLSNVLGLSDATEIGPNGQAVPQIFDGDTFTLFDGTTFVTFEFNQGFTLVATDPATITNGTLIRATIPGQAPITFELTNGVPTNAANIVIPIDRTASATTFTQTLATFIQGRGIPVSFEGTQLAFPTATSVELISPNLTAVAGLTLRGGRIVNPGNSEIKLFPTDSADVIAQRIVQAVTSENNAGRLDNVSATARGRSVLFTALVQQVTTAGTRLRAGGQANGGLITGIEMVGADLYAVSNAGGLYRVDSSSIAALGSNNNVGQYVTTATDLIGLNFTGLRAGPNDVDGGRYANLLFATTSNGDIYAFNTDGELQNVFAGGQSSISTGIGNAQGLDFATLDYNLWHVTGARGDDPGHGINQSFQNTRPSETGGNSLAFNYTAAAFNQNYGFGEGPVQNFNTPAENVRQDGQDVQSTYNFPGGARGSVQSNAFSLAGYSSADLPTMYFNYFLDTDQFDEDSGIDGGDDDLFNEDRDTLRVYVVDSRGVEHLVATNNEARSGFVGVNDEFDDPTTGLYADDIDVDVQQLYDNTGTWRQARVPLGEFAGQAGLSLRIEFSTAGTTSTNTAEIRTVAGAELNDGDTFVVGGEVFTIDLSPSIVFPSGQTLFELYQDPAARASFTIDGQTYVLDDGTRAVQTDEIAITLPTPLSSLTSGAIANLVAESFERDVAISRIVQSGNEIDLFYQENPVPIGRNPQDFYNENPELLVSVYLNGVEYVFLDEDSDRQDLNLPFNADLQAPRIGIDLINTFAILNPTAAPLVDISSLTEQDVAQILAFTSGQLQIGETEPTIDYGQLVPTGNVLDTLYSDLAQLFIVTIDDVEYVLLDTSRVATGNQVGVLLGSDLLTADIAGALQDAVEANTDVNRPAFEQITGFDFSDASDPVNPFGQPNPVGADGRNDLTFQATPLPYQGGSLIIDGRGTLGTISTTAVSNRGDVDLLSVRVDAGTQIVVNSQADQPGVENIIRFFDSEGVELVAATGGTLAVVNDARGTITLTAPEDGLYFIGVSGPGNGSYDPRIEGTTDAALTGGYALQIAIESPLAVLASGATVEFNGIATIVVPPNNGLAATNLRSPSSNAVLVSRTSTAAEVAIAVQEAVANRFYNGDTTLLPRGGSALRLPGLIDATTPLGPFVSTAQRFGDQFGGDFRGGAADNASEGAYIDDIVIGFAERGELVTNALPIGPDDAFIDFNDIALTEPDETRRNTDTGSYQLEIRDASEYVASGVVGNNFILDARFRTFDTNDRLTTEGISLVAKPASEIVDGSTFILSGENQRLTFEFNILDGDNGNNGFASQANRIEVRLPAQATAEEVADLLIARINAPDVQPILGIIANRSNLTRANTPNDVGDRNVILVGANAFRAVGDSFETTSEGGLRGDSNRDRDEQGVIMIESSRIIYSEDNGVQITRGATGNIISADAGDYTPNILPYPRNFAEINSESFLPGVVLRNNTFAFNQNVGIDIIGLENGGSATNNPVGFDRIVNNTLIGGSISQAESLGSQVFGATFFPMGGVSFADSVLDSDTIFGDDVEQSFRDSEAALGSPDCHGLAATDPADGLFTFSLGSGGRATFVFEDNLLTGSSSNPASVIGIGDGIDDLIIFETGIAERVGVEVSRDNVTYFNVGEVFGLDNTIDLDAFGFGMNDRFSYVRLTDLTPAGTFNFGAAGADIDAVGALSTVLRDEFTPGRIGIQVEDNAAPSLINNVFANFQTGISIAPVPPVIVPLPGEVAAPQAIDFSSVQTVIGGSTFFRNNEASRIAGVNGVGLRAQFLDDLDQVFVDPFNLIFTPQSRTPIIDSGLSSVEDRNSLQVLRNSVGLPVSPIIAPELDANGQTRVDDPTFNPAFGSGANAFIDRGAEERTDSEGPRFVLTSPRGQDLIFDNATDEFGRSITRGTIFDAFEIQLVDGIRPADSGPGVGVNDNTVSSQNLLVTRLIAGSDRVETLQEGRDYRFAYEPADNMIRITPIAGIWTDDSVYTIEFIGGSNGSVDGFTAVLQGQPGIGYGDGQKNFIDGNILETDLGIQLSVPSDALIVTDAITGISRPAISEQTVTIFDGINAPVTFEFVTDLTTPINANGQLEITGNYAVRLPTTASPQLIVQLLAREINAVSATGVLDIEAVHRIEPATGQSGRLQLLSDNANAHEAFVTLLEDSVFRQVNQELDVQLLTEIAIGANGERLTNYDGQQVVVFDGTRELTFEFDTDNNLTVFNPDVNGFGIGIDDDASPRELVQALLDAFRDNDLDVTAFGASGTFRIRGTNGPISVSSPTGATLVTGNSAIGVTPGFGLQIPVINGALSPAVQDGQSFTIGRGLGTPVAFEIDFDNTLTNLDAVRISIPGGGFDTTPDQLATAIANAINGVFPLLGATNAGAGRVTLAQESDIQLNTAGTILTQIGSPGDGASMPVVIRYNDDANTVAAAFADAAISAGIDATLNDERVLLRTVGTPQGDAVVTNFIADKAGNRLQPGSERIGSRVEILVGALFDYGDASGRATSGVRIGQPYTVTLQDDGPRHRIVDDLYLGSSVTADVNGVNDDADNDDGITQLGVLKPGFGTQFELDMNRIAGTANHVSASRPFFVDAWFDWNGNGAFDANEVTRFGSSGTGLRVISDQSVNTIVIDVPSTATVGPVQSRFRLSYESGLTANGLTDAGEVEDYTFTISNNPFQSSRFAEDVNDSGTVTPLDALLIINLLNANNGPVDLNNVPAGLTLPPFPDVNGDGMISAIDALQVINYLNRTLSPGVDPTGEPTDNLLGEPTTAAVFQSVGNGVMASPTTIAFDPTRSAVASNDAPVIGPEPVMAKPASKTSVFDSPSSMQLDSIVDSLAQDRQDAKSEDSDDGTSSIDEIFASMG